MRRLWPLLLLAALLTGCGVPAGARLGQAAHVTVYLPTRLPKGLRYAGGKSIGKGMVYLRYAAKRRTLALFESPNPIALPPGSSQDGKGVWEAVAIVEGKTVRSLLLRRPRAYVEAVATGLSAADLKVVQDSLRAYAP